MDLVDLLINCLAGLGILFGPVATIYIKERAKNRALLLDVAALEDEKQRVISKYKKQLESVKKEHSLDIEKRRYLYESKAAAFKKFTSSLDDMQNDSSKYFEAIMANVEWYSTNSRILGTEEGYLNIELLCDEYLNRTLRVCNQISKDFIFVKNQTSELRMSVPNSIEAKLDELLNGLQNLMDASMVFMRKMGTAGLRGESVDNFLMDNCKSIGRNVEIIRGELVTAMKKDLELI
jgi:hypothetical protein